MTATASEIAARLDRLPMTRTIWRLVTLISLGGAFELYELFLTGFIAPGLVASGIFANSTVGFFGLNGLGFFVFSNFAGMWLGCMFMGHVADRFGRRAIFVWALVWYSVCTAIMAFQTTAVGIDLWRFLAGIGVGLEQVTIDAYIPEFVPPRYRGKAFAYYQFVEFCIVPIVALLAWLLVPTSMLGLEGWRWVALIGSAGALIAWWLRLGLPESPRWLALHGRETEADRVTSDIETRVAREYGKPLPPLGPALPIESGKGTFAEIFSPQYRKRTIVLSVFNLMQTIGFYGFNSWVPTLIMAQGIDLSKSLQYAFIIAIANPIGPLLGMFIADRMERKWQLVCAGVGIGGFMYLFSQQTDLRWIILFGVLVTLANNWMSFAFHNYQGELFPTRIRSRAVGFVYGWSRISAGFAGLWIGFFLQRTGVPGVAAFIAAAMFVMVVTIGGFGPRTRHLTLEEIAR